MIQDPNIERYVDLAMKPVLRQIKELQSEIESLKKALHETRVSGSASDFERELYKLINTYVSAGLKKPDLVRKMEYVTQSCRVS